MAVNDGAEVEDRVIVDLAKTSAIEVFAEPPIKVENYSKEDAESS